MQLCSQLLPPDGDAFSPFECMFARKPPCRLLDLDPTFWVPERLQHATSSLVQSMARRVIQVNKMWYDWATEFQASEEQRRDCQGHEEAGEAHPTAPRASPAHGPKGARGLGGTGVLLLEHL